MTANPRRRPFRNRQRRIRRRQALTGESYMTAAAAVEAEWEQGQRYLSDPSVPVDVAAAVRRAGLIPLEPMALSPGWDWWCRCRWCSAVVDVRPTGHGYQSPGRCPYFLDAGGHATGRCTRPAPEPDPMDAYEAMIMLESAESSDSPPLRTLALRAARLRRLRQLATARSADPDAEQAG